MHRTDERKIVDYNNRKVLRLFSFKLHVVDDGYDVEMVFSCHLIHDHRILLNLIPLFLTTMKHTQRFNFWKVQRTIF